MTTDGRDRSTAGSARYLQPATLHSTSNSYSHAVEIMAGRPVYLAGQVALDADGALVGAGDIRAQTRQVFTNLGAALAAVGAGFDDLVKLNYYVLDPAHIPAIREVRDEFVAAADRPASTAVAVVGLVQPELLIEIEAVALLGATDGHAD